LTAKWCGVLEGNIYVFFCSIQHSSLAALEVRDRPIGWFDFTNWGFTPKSVFNQIILTNIYLLWAVLQGLMN
jgi:hypothetical protein